MERDYSEKMPLVVVVELAVGWDKPTIMAIEVDLIVDSWVSTRVLVKSLVE